MSRLTPMEGTWARRASGGSVARTVLSQRRLKVAAVKCHRVKRLLRLASRHFTETIHSVPHMLARLFLVEEGIAATLARDRLRFTLAVRVSWDL